MSLGEGSRNVVSGPSPSRASPAPAVETIAMWEPGLPAMAAEQALNYFQPDLMLIQQLHQRWHWLLIGHQAVHQTDRPQANHGIAPEFA
ncbi:hypothetical protein SAMN04490179_5557 [Pseudomonas antarctica]|uniref:Uncharacterized protein n=1 Tax=Pseudomonas antarctica TaxID=219572 RepID=A0A1H0DNJ8_9PSED|nr:hypothetical protein PSAN_02030 [Pseudomonas antarctica]SDN71649.1 hypothetical protein SAMN04490179_5557 [Pseudomonas antarctica]